MAEEEVQEEVEQETTEEEVETDDTVSEESAEESEDGDAEEENPEADESNEEEPESAEPDEHEIKVYGQTFKVSTDKLIEMAQKGAGADAKFEEINQKNQQLLKVVEDLKTRPFEVMKNIGADPRKAAEDFLIQKMQEDELSDEQKRILELERQVKAQDELREQQKKDGESRQLAVEVEKMQGEFEQEFIEALQEVDVPNTEVTISRMANYMLDAQQNEGITLTAKQAAQLVRSDIEVESSTIYKASDVEKAMKLLGPDMIKKIKNFEATQVKSPQDKNKVDKKEEVKAVFRPKGRGGKSYSQLKEELDAKFGGDPFDYNPALDGE
jgi:hypothetical protein